MAGEIKKIVDDKASMPPIYAKPLSPSQDNTRSTFYIFISFFFKYRSKVYANRHKKPKIFSKFAPNKLEKNMGLGKWIGGIVGFMAAGPLGALAGYAIGSMLESNDEDNFSGGGYSGSRNTYENQAYGQHFLKLNIRILHSINGKIQKGM